MINYTINVSDLEYFLLVLTRISMFISVAPLYGQRGIPNRVKIGFSFFVAVLIYGTIPDKTPLDYNTVWGYAAIVLREGMTGLLIGFAANMATTIVAFAGRIIDMETGMSMANLVDPTTHQQESISGVLYQYVITLILIITGLHRYLITALAQTFILIPINKAVFDSTKLLDSIVTFLNDYIMLGFRICLPVFAVMLLLNAILGIMTKLAPQMNMFSVGMQLKVLVGLSTLFITVGMLPIVGDMISGEIRKMMVVFVNAMT
ncbi:MAG: flagellar biosynthetic protein FliR [Lachnospiraceae bacterium]|nr:flagellar biosynthetic protein FliR [Lachnospiraceae bacterium]MBP5745555.1 flagellar biosynthetic protein FliR [Lachnospiraceae bacterium]MBR6148864.1 flagellar biosynthetic protein FliR [Lachnospiraceae bacterium]